MIPSGYQAIISPNTSDRLTPFQDQCTARPPEGKTERLLIKEILNIRSDIPVTLCTGFSEKIDEAKAKAIGAADYIEKPLDIRNFAFKVRKVLDEAKGSTQG